MSTTITRRTVTFPLFQGDDLAEVQRLAEAVNVAITSFDDDSPRLNSDPDPRRVAAQAYDEFVTDAETRAVSVTLMAVGRKEWREIVAKHPPREDDKADQRVGFNVQTLGDDAVPACLTAPTFATDAAREEWLDSLSHAQFERLFNAAFELNAGMAPDPKADLSSRLARTIDEI